VRDVLARGHEMDPSRVRRLLDDLVRFAIRLQEQASLDVVSDGEWRRTQYIREFLSRVGGFERCRRFTHQGEAKTTEVAVRCMTATEPVFVEDARFLVAPDYPSRCCSHCPRRHLDLNPDFAGTENPGPRDPPQGD
jgi:methionine synthase II (cobalamin-independent)